MTYKPLDAFGTDDGELDTLTPQQAFTLGVEWALVRAMAMTGEDIHTHPVHADNRRRLTRLLSDYGYHQEWDVRDDWSFVTASREAPG